MFDVKLPNDFIPKNADEEMASFELTSIDEVLDNDYSAYLHYL